LPKASHQLIADPQDGPRAAGVQRAGPRFDAALAFEFLHGLDALEHIRRRAVRGQLP